MKPESSRKALIVIMLGLLTASAFFIRLENFKNSKLRSIDEIVYYRMAKQVLEEGPSGYHTMPYGKEMADAGRPLPDYFFQPLFKHPPVFTFLVALSLKIFGPSLVSAVYVSLFFGVMFIPLTYLLGSLLLGRKTGFFSAFLMWMDPINIICSQKVWLETTQSFFILSAVYFFLYALKRNKDICFVISGVAGGLAVLTKYPGMIAWISILLYAAIAHRFLFKNKYFLLGGVVSFVMLWPWFYWNSLVYGSHFLVKQISAHNLGLGSPRTICLIVAAAGVLSLVFYQLRQPRAKTGIRNPGPVASVKSWDTKKYLVAGCGVLLIWSIHGSILRAFSPVSVPTASWAQGLFWDATSVFYFGRLIEFSLIFLLAFAAFFINRAENFDVKLPLFIVSGALILFYMVWRSYQSRYILAAIPFLIVLGVHFWMECFNRVSGNKNQAIYFGGRLALRLFIIYALVKTTYINGLVSFPNDMCYF